MKLLKHLLKTRVRPFRFVWILLAFASYFAVLGFEEPFSQSLAIDSPRITILTASADPSSLAETEKNHATKKAKPSLVRPRLFISNTGHLPSWTRIQLDEAMNIEILDSSFSLNQTRNHLGSEYFNYSNYLFSQMAQQSNDLEVNMALNRVIKSSNELKTYMDNSGKTWFDGTPTTNMNHLQIRSYIMGNLNQLNTGGIHRTDYNNNGSVQDFPLKESHKKPGESLQRFLKNVETLKQTQFMKTHPEALKAVNKQSQLLTALAMNLELRWESSLSSKGDSSQITRMRIFAEQTLRIEPSSMVTSASIIDFQ